MAKGSNFEREMCRLFSLWWSEGKSDDVFWRSAGSGAMAKTRSKVGKSTFGQYGDIQATDPIGQPLLDKFTIEMKRGYSKLTFADMLDKTESAAVQGWEKFLLQVLEDRKNAKSYSWLLITRRDRREALVFLTSSIAGQLMNNDARLDKIANLVINIKLKNGRKMSIFGCKLSDFMKKVTPKMIQELGLD